MLVDFPPFGITNAENQPDGYDADVAKLLAKDLGVKLNIVPVTGPNRIPFLLTNQVDMLVASLGDHARSAPSRSSSPSPMPASTSSSYAPKKARDLNALPTSRAMRVGVARASTQDTAVTEVAPEGTKIRRFDDDATAVQALMSGQVDAIGAQHTSSLGDREARARPLRARNSRCASRSRAIAMRPGQDELLSLDQRLPDREGERRAEQDPPEMARHRPARMRRHAQVLTTEAQRHPTDRASERDGDRMDRPAFARSAHHVSDQIIIRMEGVNKWYGKFQVLNNIDLDVRAGRAHRDLRPVGLGQVDPDPLHQPARDHPEGPHRRRRHRARRQRPRTSTPCGARSAWCSSSSTCSRT